jgi:DNA-binding MarR family transcriptional regulator
MKHKSKNIQMVEQIFIVTALLRKSGEKRIFRNFGLTTSLFTVLGKIASGKRTSTEIQEYVEGTPSSITQKIKQLEKRNLIVRQLDEKDNRRWIFELTEIGKQIITQIQPEYEEQLNKLFRNFDEDIKAEFLQFLREMEKKLRP